MRPNKLPKDTSNAKFDNIDPELRRMIEDRTLKTIEIEDAAMRLKGGTLTLRASDLLPKEKKPDTPRDPNQPMTGAERQQKLYQDRTEAGWKKTWVPPKLIAEAMLLTEKGDLTDGMDKLQSKFYELSAERDEWKRRAQQSWLNRLFRRN